MSQKVLIIEEIMVEVYWGVSGGGKSHKAMTENPDAYVLDRCDGTLFFDGYDGQKVLIIEEFDGWINFEVLKRILDKWKF